MKQSFNLYRRALRNRPWMTLWTGVSISQIGDCFFNLSVMWVVFSTSHSLFQTSLIQVVWHLDRILIGPIAGAFSDRWDRKKIIIVLNLLSALVVGLLAAVMQAAHGVNTIVVFCAVFILNSLNTFLAPSMFAVVADIVEPELMPTTQGLMSSIGNLSYFIGGLLAGVILSQLGSTWAIVGDAISFGAAAVFTWFTSIPQKRMQVSSSKSIRGLFRDIRDGWREIDRQPIVKWLVWLYLLINACSMLGPLIPGLVKLQLHRGPMIMGTLDACSVVGGILGGIAVGTIERKLGAGKLLGIGWIAAGMCLVFEGISTSVYLTGGLFLMEQVFNTMVGAAMGAVTAIVVPENFRGRVWGLVSSIGVISIPMSSLIGGRLADLIGPGHMFILGGIWKICVAILALSIKHVRSASVLSTTAGQDPAVTANP